MGAKNRLFQWGFIVAGAAVMMLACLGTPSFFLAQEHNTGSYSAEAVIWPADLNRVGKDQLMLLDGMSDTLAGRIIAYREEHGGFQSVEELDQVRGIGEKRMAAWGKYFTV